MFILSSYQSVYIIILRPWYAITKVVCKDDNFRDDLLKPVRSYEIEWLVKHTIAFSRYLNESFNRSEGGLPLDRLSRFKSWRQINYPDLQDPTIPKFRDIPLFLARIVNSFRFNLRWMARWKFVGALMLSSSLSFLYYYFLVLPMISVCFLLILLMIGTIIYLFLA